MNGRKQTCPVVEQAVGYALHALEPDEEMAVAAHVVGCPACRAAVRDTEEVLAGLALAEPQAEPPASLRSGLLAAVAETPQNTAGPTAPRPAEKPVEADVRPRRVDHDDARRAPWRPSRRLAVAATALIAVIAVGGLGARTAQLDQERTQSSEAIATVLDEMVPAGARHAVLTGPDGATVGAVVIDKGVRQVLTVNLADNPEDHVYVLWGIAGTAAPIPLGTFDVNTPAARMRSVGSMVDSEGFTAYAVSLEPGRTAPAAPSSVTAEGRVV